VNIYYAPSCLASLWVLNSTEILNAFPKNSQNINGTICEAANKMIRDIILINFVMPFDKSKLITYTLIGIIALCSIVLLILLLI